MHGCLGVDLSRGSSADVLADAMHLPFRDSCADFVYSRRCIEVTRNDGKALSEIYRVLAPGGMANLICESWMEWLYYKLFVRKPYRCFHLYFKANLQKLLVDAGFQHFEIVKVKGRRRLGFDWNVRAIKA